MMFRETCKRIARLWDNDKSEFFINIVLGIMMLFVSGIIIWGIVLAFVYHALISSIIVIIVCCIVALMIAIIRYGRNS